MLVNDRATTETYNVTYKEARFGPADRGPPRAIAQVALTIDGQTQPLKIASSDQKLRRGELDSVATATLPGKLVRVLASDDPASLTIETDSAGNPRTSIRVGNAGFGRNFRDFDRVCSQAHGHAGSQAQSAPIKPVAQVVP
jgi:hypothetical protein